MKPELLVKNLYEETLINPLLDGSLGLNRLLIVSGYATAAMASRHIADFVENERGAHIDLIYGMVKKDGILRSVHLGFNKIVASNNSGYKFTCSYLADGEPVHAKIYIWCKNDQPVLAFTGSANYTESAFICSLRKEVLTETNPKQALKFFNSLKNDAICCSDPSVAGRLKILLRENKQLFGEDGTKANAINGVQKIVDVDSQFYGLDKATVSLVDRYGRVPERSNLNWGQRPEYNRDKNQAYLALRGEIRNSDFFPPRGFHFTVLTDDNYSMQCVRAQDGDKAIHTPHDNAELGRYFRKRLGLKSGALVTAADLNRYGRTAVDFYKIDDENFFMDFSKPQ